MRLKQEWQARISGRQAFLSIAIVAVLLGCMGMVNLATGYPPQIPRAALALLLALVLGQALFALVKRGKRAYTAVSGFKLFGCVLFLTGNLLPESSIWHSRSVNVGAALMCLTVLTSLVEPRRRPETTFSPAAPSV